MVAASDDHDVPSWSTRSLMVKLHTLFVLGTCEFPRNGRNGCALKEMRREFAGACELLGEHSAKQGCTEGASGYQRTIAVTVVAQRFTSELMAVGVS